MHLKKLLAFVLTWVLGIAGSSAGMVTVFAANPWDGMVETSVLEKVTDTLTEWGQTEHLTGIFKPFRVRIC